MVSLLYDKVRDKKFPTSFNRTHFSYYYRIQLFLFMTMPELCLNFPRLHFFESRQLIPCCSDTMLPVYWWLSSMLRFSEYTVIYWRILYEYHFAKHCLLEHVNCVVRASLFLPEHQKCTTKNVQLQSRFPFINWHCYYYSRWYVTTIWSVFSNNHRLYS